VFEEKWKNHLMGCFAEI